jgi:hypothetical protein
MQQPQVILQDVQLVDGTVLAARGKQHHGISLRLGPLLVCRHSGRLRGEVLRRA